VGLLIIKEGKNMKIDLNEHLCFNFYSGWREMASFYKDALGKDVSPQNVYVLELCELKERITMNNLSKAMNLDGSAVSTLISRMEKKDLVVRTHGVKDRRCVYVQLTEKGNQFREKLRLQTGVLIENATRGISKDDISKLQVIVKKIAENRADFREVA
jgi:DNA-binding MarR family transcriptional regulator